MGHSPTRCIGSHEPWLPVIRKIGGGEGAGLLTLPDLANFGQIGEWLRQGSLQPSISPTILARGTGCTDKREIFHCQCELSKIACNSGLEWELIRMTMKQYIYIYIYIYTRFVCFLLFYMCIYIYIYIYIYINICHKGYNG